MRKLEHGPREAAACSPNETGKGPHRNPSNPKAPQPEKQRASTYPALAGIRSGLGGDVQAVDPLAAWKPAGRRVGNPQPDRDAIGVVVDQEPTVSIRFD